MKSKDPGRVSFCHADSGSSNPKRLLLFRGFARLSLIDWPLKRISRVKYAPNCCIATRGGAGIYACGKAAEVPGPVLGQKGPHSENFSVSEIMQNGLTAPNHCGSIPVESRPGNLFVFAKNPTFWEKMRE
jgi:hypothetical protein